MKVVPVLFLLLLLILSDSVAQYGFDLDNRELDERHHQLKLATEDSSRVQALISLANYHKFNRADSGIYYATKAIVLARDNGYTIAEMSGLQFLSASYSTLGNDSKSLRINLEGLRLYDGLKETEKRNGARVKGRIQNNLGNYYFKLGDYQKSLSYYKSSLNTSKSIKDFAFISIMWNHIGKTLFELGELDSAYYYAYIARDLGDSINLIWVMNNNYRALAYIQRESGQLDSSIIYYKKALINSNNSSSGASSVLLNLARLYESKNQLDSSRYYAKRSLQIAIDNRIYPRVISTSAFFTEFYEENDPRKALFYNKMRVAYMDSLSELGKMVAYNDLIDYDVQIRKQELAEAEANFKNRLRNNALLGSSFTLLVIAFFLYRNGRNNRKAKEKVERAYSELEATQTQLIHAEKMASLGEMTAGIAHEIQNPLNFVNNFSDVNKELAEELLEELKKGNEREVKEIIKDIIENDKKINHHGHRADAIVKSMLQHSRGSSGEKEMTDINALCDEYMRLAYHGLRAKDKSFNADFKLQLDENLPNVNVVPQDIGRVLLNLVTNAFQACTEQSESASADRSVSTYKPLVTITTRRVGSPSGAGGSVEISFQDNGPGIPDDVKEKIFEPFFTTKDTGEGTGLGLSMSYDIITKGHGGEIEVKSKEGEGSEFLIILPV